MIYRLLLTGLLAGFMLFAMGCSPAASDTTDTSSAAAAMQVQAPTGSAASAQRPDWHYTPLVDVRTGNSFTLADFAGKTVYVEPMATWCTNCRHQLTDVATARSQLNNDDYVFVSFSVETTLTNDQLKTYTDTTGFDWAFAVLSPEMLTALTTQFGLTIANPPSTPHFIIKPDGSMTSLTTGFESPDQVIANMKAAAGAGA